MDLILAGKLAWGAMVTCWYFLRLPFELRARRVRVAQDRMDRREWFRILVAFAGLGVLPGAYMFGNVLAFADRAPSAILFVAGLFFAAGAAIFTRLAHKALGEMWSVSLQLKEGHRLVTSGIYAHVRHPIYTSYWCAVLAQACLLSNWLAGLSGLAGFAVLYFLRVGEEERMMEERFGEEYREYCRRTKRLVPFLF